MLERRIFRLSTECLKRLNLYRELIIDDHDLGWLRPDPVLSDLSTPGHPFCIERSEEKTADHTVWIHGDIAGKLGPPTGRPFWVRKIDWCRICAFTPLA